MQRGQLHPVHSKDCERLGGSRLLRIDGRSRLRRRQRVTKSGSFFPAMLTVRARTRRTRECKSRSPIVTSRVHPSSLVEYPSPEIMDSPLAPIVCAATLLWALAGSSCQHRWSAEPNRSVSGALPVAEAAGGGREATFAGATGRSPDAMRSSAAAVASVAGAEADGGSPSTKSTVRCADRPSANPECLYFAQEQGPPAGFRPLSRGPVATFPQVRYASVLAVVHHQDGLRLDSLVPGCDHRAVAPDGTFCPSVTFPGTKLSREQADRLLTVVAQRDDAAGRTALRCGFDPQLSFVFLNHDDAPVAELDVDLDCGKWGALPQPQSMHPVIGAGQKELVALCRELRLPLCACETVRPADAAVGPMQQPEPPAVEAARPLSSATPLDRRRLCAWSTLRMTLARGLHASDFVACPGGRPQYWIASVRSCIEGFPSCEIPIGTVETCFQHLDTDACLESQKTRAACGAAMRCLWGITWKTP